MGKLPCIILIGMPGVGKTTIGGLLGAALDMAFMDTDALIESIYGCRLQDLTDALGKNAFLDVESSIITTINASHCVIATGGSVVYKPEAINHLRRLGPIIYLKLNLDEIASRIQRNPERGIAIAPGQSLGDLFKEREGLYEYAANIICDCDGQNPEQCMERILLELYKQFAIQRPVMALRKN